MMFTKHIGIDYSGRGTPLQRLSGLQVYAATGDRLPGRVNPPSAPTGKDRNWCRKEVAEWLLQQVASGDTILTKLGDQVVQGRDLALLLHTHGHSDHCGSTKQLKEVTSAPTAIHPADAAVIENGRNQATKPTCLTARLLHWLVDDDFPPVRPDILLPDEMSLPGFGVDGTVVFTPGHTVGSISVLLNSGEAIVGDLLMGGWLGGLFRSGQPGYPYYADDLGQVRASVKKLLGLGASKFFVGHGGPLEAGGVTSWLERVGAIEAARH